MKTHNLIIVYLICFFLMVLNSKLKSQQEQLPKLEEFNPSFFHYVGLNSEINNISYKQVLITNSTNSINFDLSNGVIFNYGLHYSFNKFDCKQSEAFRSKSNVHFEGKSRITFELDVDYFSFQKEENIGFDFQNNKLKYNTAHNINGIKLNTFALFNFVNLANTFFAIGLNNTIYLKNEISESITSNDNQDISNIKFDRFTFDNSKNKYFSTNKSNKYDLGLYIGLKKGIAIKYMNNYKGEFEGEYNFAKLEFNLGYQYNIINAISLRNKGVWSFGLTLKVPLPLNQLSDNCCHCFPL